MTRPGPSTDPQSKWPYLGMYVVRRNLRKTGADAGTWRILFEVPARLRPVGWPPTISLPRARPYCTGPDDLKAIVRIRDDAEALVADMKQSREGAPVIAEADGSIPWLIREWGGMRLLAAVRGEIEALDCAMNPGDGASDSWLDLEPRTRRLYVVTLRHILGWSEMNNHRHVRFITPEAASDFLNIWKGKRKQRESVRMLLGRLLRIAKAKHKIASNPLDDVETPRRKKRKGGRRTSVTCWPRSAVDVYAETARTKAGWRAGRGGAWTAWPGGSILVQLMYQTAADSTDVITWRKGKGGHFVDDLKLPGIDFDRGKTGDSTFIPISAELAREIREAPSIYLVVDPSGRPYRPTIDDAKLRGHMGTLRDHAVSAGADRLVFDHLRHSAATEAVESGVDLDDVRHLTAHKDSTMNRNVYVQQRKEKTIEIQRARGIIS